MTANSVFNRTGWHVTVMTKNGQRIIHHCQCDDQKEVQGVCTEARSHSLSYKIVIRSPTGQISYWDDPPDEAR